MKNNMPDNMTRKEARRILAAWENYKKEESARAGGPVWEMRRSSVLAAADDEAKVLAKRLSMQLHDYRLEHLQDGHLISEDPALEIVAALGKILVEKGE